jgi:hypothetical protein
MSHSTSSIFSSILITALTPRTSQSVAARPIAVQKLGSPTIASPFVWRFCRWGDKAIYLTGAM